MSGKSKGTHTQAADKAVDIVADVVKIRVASDEQLERAVPVSGLGEVKTCKVEVVSRRITMQANAWKVRINLRVVIRYVNKWGNLRTTERLIAFEKLVSFPGKCECHRFIPRVEISDLTGEAIPLLDHGLNTVLAAVGFHMVVKGLLQEEITVLTRRNGD